MAVSDKGADDRLKPFMVFQPDPVHFSSWHNPSQGFTEKHVSYPRLTTTLMSPVCTPGLSKRPEMVFQIMWCTSWGKEEQKLVYTLTPAWMQASGSQDYLHYMEYFWCRTYQCRCQSWMPSLPELFSCENRIVRPHCSPWNSHQKVWLSKVDKPLTLIGH